MKKINIESLKPYLKGARYISIGTTAICFLMPNGRVLKLFVNTYRKQQLFKLYPNIVDHLDEISEIKNDSYIPPEEVLIKNNVCVGYIYDYIKAKELKHIKLNTKINDLIDAYSKLEEDTHKISDKKFKLYDLHDKNILFNGNYKIIDLDRGHFFNEVSDKIYNFNIQKINKTIIYSILGIKIYDDLNFINKDLDELYKESIYGEKRDITQLLNEIMDRNIKTVFDLKIKSKKLINTSDNNYQKNTY